MKWIAIKEMEEYKEGTWFLFLDKWRYLRAATVQYSHVHKYKGLGFARFVEDHSSYTIFSDLIKNFTHYYLLDFSDGNWVKSSEVPSLESITGRFALNTTLSGIGEKDWCSVPEICICVLGQTEEDVIGCCLDYRSYDLTSIVATHQYISLFKKSDLPTISKEIKE